VPLKRVYPGVRSANFHMSVASMSAPRPLDDITTLLVAWARGEESALAQLTPLVHGELRRLARSYLRRERDGHTLQTDALVNEAYVRLIDLSRVEWRDRTHFFALAARLMRRILVDYARSRQYQKRGGGARRVPLDDAVGVGVDRTACLIALDDSLAALAVVDTRKAQVVELRFFGGLSIAETSETLQVSPETVMRDWRFAKLWLLRELSSGPQP
jgi:RNA polymerase sigma-70 factor, ECF subfamily